MRNPFLLFALLVAMSIPKISAASSPIDPFVGLWVTADLYDKKESCQAHRKGNITDGTTLIQTNSYSLYGNPDCKISKVESTGKNTISIDARCGSRAVKETWSIKNNILEKKGKNYAVKYERCPK